MSAERNLLFGILALQLDFVSRGALVDALKVWVLDQTRLLADLLESSGSLTHGNRELLEAVLARHVEQHANDVRKSLAAVHLDSRAKHELQAIQDDALQSTLSIISSGGTSEVSARASVSVGQPTSRGTRFQVLRGYREGGLGVVSIAQDSELDREVALKEMKPRFAHDLGGRIRFVREAEITGGLEHPNIVPVYGLGTHDDGRPFYAMRLIRGDTSLADEIKSFHAVENRPYAANQNLRLRTLLQRFIAVCDAIEYSHSRGVIHRDLKPANVMLGKFGETLVVDWGLAKLLKQSQHDSLQARRGHQEPPLNVRSSNSTDETQLGLAVGTPAYMAPEQAEGRLDVLSPAADVYGLGATLYSLLTGHLPVDGKTKEEILTNVRKGEVVPARTRVGGVPPPLEAICAKALSFKAEDRYASAGDLASDVANFLADEPVSAYREPIAARARRWSRKHPALVSGTLASALVTIVGLLIGFLVLGQKNRELAEKEAIASAVRDFLIHDLLQLARADEQASFGVRMDPKLTVKELANRAMMTTPESFSISHPAAAELRAIVARCNESNLTIRDLVVQAPARMGDSVKRHPQLESAIRAVLGAALCSIGEHDAATLELLRSYSLTESRLGPRHIDTLTLISNLAHSYREGGQLDKALPLARKSYDLRNEILGPVHPHTLESTRLLATILELSGRAKEAVKLLESNLAIQKQHFGEGHVQVLHCMNDLGASYSSANELQKSTSILETAFAKEQELLGPEHPATLRTANNLANSYRIVGRLADAEVLLKNTLHIQTHKLGRTHPDTIRTIGNYGSTAIALGRWNEAVSLCEEAYTHCHLRLVPRHPDRLGSTLNLLTLYRNLGRLGEAMDLADDLVEANQSAWGSEHPRTLEALAIQGSLLNDMGRHDDAILVLKSTLELQVAKLGKADPYSLTTMSSLAESLRATGRFEEAIELADEALRGRTSVLGPDAPETLMAMGALAFVYRSAGRTSDALPLFEKGVEIGNGSLGPDHPFVLRFKAHLAVLYRDTDRWKDALPIFLDTLNRQRKVLGEEHHETLMNMANLAAGLLGAGQPDESLKIYEQVLAKRLAAHGPDDSRSNQALSNLADAYFRCRRFQSARPLLEEIATKREAAHGPDDARTLIAKNMLASTNYYLGNIADAIRLHRDTLRRRRLLFGNEHRDSLESALNLAEALIAVKNYDESIMLYEETYSCQKAASPSDDPALMRTKSNLAVLYRETGRLSEATEMFGDVWLWKQQRLGAQHQETIRSLVGLAVAERRHGLLPQAESHLLGAFQATVSYPPAVQRQFRTIIVPELIAIYAAKNSMNEVEKWQEELKSLSEP